MDKKIVTSLLTACAASFFLSCQTMQKQDRISDATKDQDCAQGKDPNDTSRERLGCVGPTPLNKNLPHTGHKHDQGAQHSGEDQGATQ